MTLDPISGVYPRALLDEKQLGLETIGPGLSTKFGLDVNPLGLSDLLQDPTDISKPWPSLCEDLAQSSRRAGLQERKPFRRPVTIDSTSGYVLSEKPRVLVFQAADAW